MSDEPRGTGIDWQDYGPEAFKRAAELDRPILVDVGAVWCHWCHVMDRTTYEQAEVIRAVNARFVAIRVDRDRRPDVDRRLQQAVAAYQYSVSGRAGGGWPLTAFLTPKGALIHGETYMPPDRFLRVAEAVTGAYRKDAGEFERREEALARLTDERRARRTTPGRLPEGLDEVVRRTAEEEFDARHGGFGAAPKFPAPPAVRLLLRLGRERGDHDAFGMALKTLTAQAQGGLRDHVGGGFHRYSVDPRWVVPHFEKMLDVNVGLLDNYLDLARAAPGEAAEAARATAADTLRFLDQVLTDRDRGGFLASQDADVGLDDDGSYFTWSLADFRAAVPADVADLAVEFFGVTPVGDMERIEDGERTPTDRNVLHVTTTAEALARKEGTSVRAVRAAVERALAALRAARARRPEPAVDRTLLVDWNAEAVRGYLKAAVVLNRPEARVFALRTVERLLAEAYDPPRAMAHVVTPEGEAREFGHLADNARFAAALLDAYAAIGERRYLDTARALVDLALARLWDGERGGFFDVEPAATAVGLFRRPYKDVQDQSLPSTNAVAAETLVRLWRLTGADLYRERAEQALAALGEVVVPLGLMAAGLTNALDWLTGEPAHVVVIGPFSDERTRRLHEAALRTDHPRLIVQPIDPARDGDLLAALGYTALDRPAALVCGRDFCLPPAFEPGELGERAAELARGGA